jgi:hypothetical protein
MDNSTKTYQKRIIYITLFAALFLATIYLIAKSDSSIKNSLQDCTLIIIILILRGFVQ